MLEEQAGIVIPEMALLLQKTGSYVLKQGTPLLVSANCAAVAFPLFARLLGPDIRVGLSNILS
jgi:hypothetical protein